MSWRDIKIGIEQTAHDCDTVSRWSLNYTSGLKKKPLDVNIASAYAYAAKNCDYREMCVSFLFPHPPPPLLSVGQRRASVIRTFMKFQV